jgi:tetratricopeptide (TPR) repeat protein
MEHSFSELFKKYRLRAEFEKLSELGNALSDKGLRYENSLFSHWQKGNRIPTNRNLLLQLIEIFIERGAMTSLQEANEFLESAHQGYLTQKELEQLPTTHLQNQPFQVPKDILNFSGRQDIIESLRQTITEEAVTVIYGPAGVGKTALAIHLGHILKNQFRDGVLWYRLDTSDTKDILAAIAFSFGESIEHIKDVEIRSAFVRSLLSKKKALLILDNAEQYSKVRMLIPNGSSCSVIITSQYKTLGISGSYKLVPLAVFSEKETLTLYYQILGHEYVEANQETLLQCAEMLEHLPLAISIFAKQIKNSSFSVEELQEELVKEKIALETLIYQDKNFYASVTVSFKHLSQSTKKLFISLGIFDGKDFSLEAVAAINGISPKEAAIIIEALLNASLIENSTKNRYRLHLFIKTFVRQKTMTKTTYLQAVQYFEKFLENNFSQSENVTIIQKEIDNIIGIFQYCYQTKLYEEVTKLWKYLGDFLYSTGDWEKTLELGKLAYKSTKITKDYTNHVTQSIRILYIIAFWQGDLKFAEELANESLELATSLENDLLIALSQQIMSEIYKAKHDFPKALELLEAALHHFTETNNTKQLCYTLKYIGETYIVMDEIEKAEIYLQKALAKAKELNDSNQFANISSLLGGIFFSKGAYKESKNYFLQALDYELEYKKRGGNKIWANIGLALIAKEEKKDKLAEQYVAAAKLEVQYLGIKNVEKLYLSDSHTKNKLKEYKLFQ